MSTPVALKELGYARKIADYADQLGVSSSEAVFRKASNHMGAVLADAILQAGVNYRTVVRVRIERIKSEFPEAATLPGLITLLDERGAAHFLLWSHPVKLSRFQSLTHFIAVQDISTTIELKEWLCQSGSREYLLGLHGIGPKTFDYLCCLVGVDCIAVDRHVRTFAGEAGVTISDYEGLRAVVSYAADLLGMSRREFDAWIWRTVSARQIDDRQLSLI